MKTEYSVEVCRTLEQKFYNARLHRPMRITRYDVGQKLIYEVTRVEDGANGRVHLLVEKFAGGGFAGQVYQVKALGIENADRFKDTLEAGNVYAMKILVPPSGFSELFRNILYGVGFQGPFQIQINPAAVRAGALWQKFIRRGAKIRFGNEKTVVDILATFVDEKIGSCGELSEWIEGRTWKMEVDDRLDLLKRWCQGRVVDEQQVGSPEYRAKRQFMANFVKLLHDMGAYELARQYEWSTCKSQPNCLKRQGTDENPSGGLTAVDFRAGLALLPFLPMSPGDFKLIMEGLGRGSLIQFDRGIISKLEAFVQGHGNDFADMRQMLDVLKASEKVYRDSVPDITHNHIRLLYERQLWTTMFDSAVTGWKIRNLVDQRCEQKLRSSKVLTLAFFVTGLIPFLGKFVRRIWCRPDWRKHYWSMLSSLEYLWRAVRAKIAEKVIIWHRAGRVNDAAAIRTAETPWRFLCHLPFSLMPAGLHRFLTDWQYAKKSLAYIVVRPIRLYFNAQLREQWLCDMIVEGQKKHILSNEDAKTILSQIKEPFIQKYLKCLAVHICTLPVTHIVAVAIAIFYLMTHPQVPRAEAWAVAGGILVFFQLIPISPGSLTRGLYVLYLIIKERNFKDYNIAVFLGFFKYIGYLAFPIQMTYRYPALARFMAGHWATEAVHIVPVFGESGALFEHWIFRVFYNWPLTIWRRMRKRAQIRAAMKPRFWHIGLCTIAATIVFVLADLTYLKKTGNLPSLKDIWWLTVFAPMACGSVVTLGAGGMVLWKRFVTATACGALVGVLSTVTLAIPGCVNDIAAGEIIKSCMWQAFVFAILATVGAIVTELKLPEPDSK